MHQHVLGLTIYVCVFMCLCPSVCVCVQAGISLVWAEGWCGQQAGVASRLVWPARQDYLTVSAELFKKNI